MKNNELVKQQLARLRIDGVGFSEAEVAEIERRAGASIAEPAKSFLRTAGGIEANLFVGTGAAAGRDVILLPAADVIDRLTHDLPSAAIIPFATCLLGDLFCLQGRDVNASVILFELEEEEVLRVADTFEEFMVQLECRP